MPTTSGGRLSRPLRFCAGGIVATCVDWGVLWVLARVLGVDALLSAAVAFCVSLLVSYMVSARFVFADGTSEMSVSFGLGFVALSCVGLVMNEAVMWLALSLLGDGSVALFLSKACATCVVMVWNYLSRSRLFGVA